MTTTLFINEVPGIREDIEMLKYFFDKLPMSNIRLYTALQIILSEHTTEIHGPLS